MIISYARGLLSSVRPSCAEGGLDHYVLYFFLNSGIGALFSYGKKYII
jgi:hypothetical protein